MDKAKLTIEKRTQNGGLKECRLFSLSALKWALSTTPPSFPDQGWNLCPLQWKCRVLTPGPPGKSQSGHFSLETGFVLWSRWGPRFQMVSLPAARNAIAVLRAQSDSLFAAPWTVPARLLSPWNFPGKNTEMGCHALLRAIFPTQGLNLFASPALAGQFFTTEPPGNPWQDTSLRFVEVSFKQQL